MFQKKQGEVADFVNFGISDGKTGIILPLVDSAKPAIGTIDPKAKVFGGTLDTVMGYFQIELADDSKDLTVFLTLWGKFR